jgi:RAT1-interacting protein
MYYGYSFESWSTADLDAPPVPGLQWGGDVNTNEQWCVVAKTRLGTERLVIGGEVDCVRGELVC